MAFFMMCRAYFTAMCEFWARDTSYNLSNYCRMTSDYPFSEKQASSTCFKNTSTRHENGTTSTYTRCKHVVEQYLLHD